VEDLPTIKAFRDNAKANKLGRRVRPNQDTILGWDAALG